jgi:hypothetical protein
MVPLRPAHESGEDWNQNGVTVTLQKPMRPAYTGRARIGTLRQALPSHWGARARCARPTGRARIGTSTTSWATSGGDVAPGRRPGEDWNNGHDVHPLSGSLPPHRAYLLIDGEIRFDLLLGEVAEVPLDLVLPVFVSDHALLG